ncbi:MAG: RNA polymerase sigma factor RpoH [Gammaproteobacteria bacterium]|nr:RNA polymerase sigma factor RpoH [Gammaproteobacteria bacterium]MBL6819389.1 RNA polymerase sigma factor RpoH [Gammaproteobacteria bacterium]MBL6898340.1 RNA polymerase sigma factor RpoH [Gammaproteobacteria bacterium]
MNKNLTHNVVAKEIAIDLESSDALNYYLAQLRETPLLTKEQEEELFQRLQNSDDMDAARKLVMSHLRFVVHIAKTYKGYGLPLLDVIQEGNVGLMKAVKKFDPSKKVRLLSFAIYWIRAEIHEFVLKNWRIVKVATTKAQRKLFFKLRSKKTSSSWLSEQETQDIASELNVDSKTVKLMESRLSGTDVAFDPVDEDDNSPASYLTQNTNPLSLLEMQDTDNDNTMKLNVALDKLDDRSKDIISQRFLSDNKPTLDDLSKKYNVSKERIRQIEEKSLATLKETILLA